MLEEGGVEGLFYKCSFTATTYSCYYAEQVEREIILRALQKTRYNKTQAAELLGVSFRQLRYQIQKLKIDDEE